MDTVEILMSNISVCSKYIREFSIYLSKSSSYNLIVYTDASWASDIVGRKSVSDCYFFVQSSKSVEFKKIYNLVKFGCGVCSLIWSRPLRIVKNFDFLSFRQKGTSRFLWQSTICFSKYCIENHSTKYRHNNSLCKKNWINLNLIFC